MYISYILIIVVCLVLSAYFSATETAFLSYNRAKIRALEEKGNKKAELVIKLTEKYDKLILTILVGNNVLNVIVASIGTLLFARLFDYELPVRTAVVSVIVLTVAILILGEIIPKSIASDYPEKFACFSAPIISVVIVILTPVTVIFSGLQKFSANIVKTENDNKMSSEELIILVDEVQQEGSIEESEGDLLKNAIEFNDRKAEDILTHRIDLEAVELNCTKDDIARVFTESGFSRILVYDDTIDNIIGTIHRKDFYSGSGITGKSIKELLVPPMFIHQSEKINDILKLFQKNKTHIAIVLDEYGGTLGIVTMEDILEELVGEIWDEHDEVVEDFLQISENTYKVDCSVNFDDFCEFFSLEKIETDSVSLGGWIMEKMEKIPVENEGFEYENLVITVSEADEQRILFATVTVTPVQPEVQEADEAEKGE